MKTRHCSGKETYIITNDLGERIQSLRMLGIKTPNASNSIFTDFHAELKDRIASLLSDLEVVTYDMKGLVEEIWTEAIHKQQSVKDALIVSSCAEIANMRRGHTLEINRIVDEHGKIVGLGPRPGHPNLEYQLNSIAEVAQGSGKTIVLVEDGIFSGTTIEYLLGQFEERQIRVTTIVAGLSFPDAKERIQKVFDGEIMIMRQVDTPHEWMPDHDFIPFAPNCGRVYGGIFGKQVLPYYTHDGLSYSIPYILPFGDPVDWASIPQKKAVEFSQFCIRASVNIFATLDKLNGRNITIYDLIGSTPRVSMPISKGSSQLPNTNMSISDFLMETLQEF